MDKERTRPFASGRAGLNLGDAAVAFVLTRSSDAPDMANPVDIVGYGSSCDAHHLTRPDLSGKGLQRAIDAALRDGDVAPSDISFISAHGTGTPYNDKMEAAAFDLVFSKESCPPIHTAKGVFGHTLGAAGSLDALAVYLTLKNGRLPASQMGGDPDPELAVHPFEDETPIDMPGISLSTSSGFGGSNAALLFRGGKS